MKKKTLKIMALIVAIMLVVMNISFAVEDFEEEEIEPDAEIVTSDEVFTDATGEIVDTSDTTDTQEVVDQTQENWETNDFYKIADNVVLDEVVDGNAFIIAQNVEIKGEVGGDLFVIAKTVTIEEGYVLSNLFIIADELNINGIVYDLYGVCTTLTISENGLIARDLRAVTDNFENNGQINRNVYLTASNIILGEASKISGDFNYTTGEEATIPDGTVAGDISKTQQVIESKTSVLDIVTSLIASVLFTYVVAFLIFNYKNELVDKIEAAVKDKSTYLKGLLIFGIPVCIFMLFITAIFAKVALVVALLYIVALILCSPIINISLGRLISKKYESKNEKLFNQYSATVIATICMWILKQIPVIGMLTYLVVCYIGIGVIFNLCKKEK